MTLSYFAAARCENACTTRCRCRCGGVAHGRNVDTAVASREFFESLPADDPHHLAPKRERARRARGEQLALLPPPATPPRKRRARDTQLSLPLDE